MRSRASVLICGLILLVPRLSAQDTEIKSARISLKPNSVAIERVTIENLRNSPLVAWHIGLFVPGHTEPIMEQDSDFGGSDGRWPTGDGPIQPHERRVIDVTLGNWPEPQTAALRLVAFADGYYQGAPRALESWRQARQARADELTYWIRAIDTMPRESAPDLRQYLADRAVERAGQMPGGATEWRNRMSGLSRQTSTLPSLLASIERVRADAARELAALKPSLAGGLPSDPDGRVTSASISSERSAKTDFVAAVENVGLKPIEALGFDIIEPGASRVSGGQGIDFGRIEGDAPGRGRIVAGEVREFPFSRSLKDGDALPSVRLKYVLFDDLSFEGLSAARDALLRTRERHAEDLAYAIAALAQAAARPSEAEALLTGKRAERARQLQEAGRPGDLQTLDDMIRQAKASPDQFAANAKAQQESLERERQRLLRHVTR